MRSYLYSIYAKFFARPFFEEWNKFLFHLGLRGLGILNFKDFRQSGEKFLVEDILHEYVTDESPLFLDAGANVGDYSRTLLQSFPGANIEAFEPNPKNFEQLSMIENERLHTHQLGLGSSEGESILFERADRNGSPHASIHQDVITDIHQQDVLEYEVEITTLDRFLKENNLDFVDFLKIDTEGNELEVLKGGKEALDREKIGLIVFEFNEMNVVSRAFMKDFRDLLEDYLFFRLLPGGLIRVPDNPVESEIFAFQNILAIPERFLD